MFKYPIAVTIDTNILDAAKYDLSENSTLRLLENYVNEGIIKVVLSNIVVRESKKHLAKQVNKVCSIARKLRAEILQESTENLVNYIGLNRFLEITKDKNILIEKSEELFDSFIQDINAEILSTDLINLDGIIDDYFEINPPFEEGEKKRKEFPDAFIANQIRKRFGETEDVAIVSNDKGFKRACQQTPNHFFFDSLGALFDKINKQKEEAYTETINIIKELQFCISSDVLEYIKNNENIDLNGLSYDKDGIVSGFNYSEFYLHDISDTSFRIHSVDEISNGTSIVTLLCEANISVDCFYEDYDNTPWDSEIKDYVFVDTIKMREVHSARFACRIKLEREEKSFKIFPFKVILGGDSRKDRYEVEEEPDIDYEQEIKDINRENLGFISLGSYESYLEEDLPNSDMSGEIITRFEKIKTFYSVFEDLSIFYDSLLEEINNSDDISGIIKLISHNLKGLSDFPNVIDEDNISECEIDEIKSWIENKGERTYEIFEDCSLPDVLNYGDNIIIKGIDDSAIILSIDKIIVTPTEGNEEYIDVNLSKGQELIARGYIKLTVGYLDFDEDGGVDNGIEDSIEYNYSEIIEKIDDYILEQRQQIEKEEKIVTIIKNTLNIIETSE